MRVATCILIGTLAIGGGVVASLFCGGDADLGETQSVPQEPAAAAQSAASGFFPPADRIEAGSAEDGARAPGAAAAPAGAASPPGLAVWGQVASPLGPLAGASITIATEGAADESRRISTDPAGSFHAVDLPRGTQIRIRVDHADHVTLRMKRTLLQERDGDLGVIVLPQAARVRGTVVNADASAAPGVEVRVLTAAGTALQDVAAALTDARGAFELVGVPAERIVVEARPALAAAARSGPFLAVAGVATDLQLMITGGLAIRGLVVDERGLPIAAAQVELISPFAPGLELGDDLRELTADPLPPATTTDAHGRFAFAGLGNGHYLLRAGAIGYVPAADIGCEPGEQELRVVLSPLRAWGGLVLDQVTQAPIESFTVTVFGQDGAAFAGAAVAYGPTPNSELELLASRGSFALLSPPSDPFRLLIEAEGRAPAFVGPFDARVRTRGWPRFLLASGTTLRGVVTDHAGQPVSGATVAIVAAPDGIDELARLRRFGRLQHAGARQAPCDAGGHYEMVGVQRGRYEVSAGVGTTARGRPVHVVLNGEAEVQVDLHVDAPGAITGTVFDAMGPRAEATVCLLTGAEVTATTTTNPAGCYVFDAIPAGDFGLAVSVHGAQSLAWSADPGVRQAIDAVRVSPGETTRRDLVLPARAAVRGTVTLDGAPIVTAPVMLSPLGVPAAMFGKRDARTDATGAFAIADLAPGRYEILARGERDGWPERREIELSAGEIERVDFAVGDLAITGIAIDATSGAAAGGVTVRGFAGADPRSSLHDPGAAQMLQTQADDQGRFALRGLRPGEWQVSAEGSGRVTPIPLRVVLTQSAEVELVVHPAAELTILCVDRDTGAAVGLFRAELIGKDGARYESIADTKGEMYFPGVAAGSFVLRSIEADIHGEMDLLHAGDAAQQAIFPVAVDG